jgi:hypothetical protein
MMRALNARLIRPGAMCSLYSITTNQAAIIDLFRVINRSAHIKRQPTTWRSRRFGLNNGLVQRAPMRWSDVGLFIEVLQLGFETLIEQEERLQGPVNVASVFFDQSVYQVVNRHRRLPWRLVPSTAPSGFNLPSIHSLFPLLGRKP